MGILVPLLVLLTVHCATVTRDSKAPPAAVAQPDPIIEVLRKHLQADSRLTESADYQGLVNIRNRAKIILLRPRFRAAFYANTPAAWAAFADAMGSKQTYVNYLGQEVSEALYLIVAYGQYFDAKSFRWPEYDDLLYVRGDEFRTRAADYLRRISSEIERTHGVSIAVRADLFVSHEAMETFDVRIDE